MAVECEKPFLDIIYGFPVIVMTRGGCPKKTTLAKPGKCSESNNIPEKLAYQIVLIY